MTTNDTAGNQAAADLGFAIDDLMRAFEAFKDTNDQRLDEIERRASADVLTTEKLDRIDRALDDNKRIVDELALKSARPSLGSTALRSGAALQHKAAFEAYVRKGKAAALRDLEAKALSVGTDADGGYLVPDELERAVNRAVRNVSPIRAIAGIRQVSGSVYKKPFAITGAESGWVAETAARPETDTPTLAELPSVVPDHGALRHAGGDLRAARRLRRQHRRMDRRGGARQPSPSRKAPPSSPATAPPSRRAFSTTPRSPSQLELGQHRLHHHRRRRRRRPAPGDKLIDLVYSVKAGYRANGTFVFNRATQAVIRKMKDGEGNYLWQPAAKAGDPSTLMGFPVAESEDMPNMAADSYSVAFGDFRRGYLIVDRVGIRVLRDPYSSKPYVLFYTTKRVGGGVQDFDAIKLLKFAA